MTVSEAANFLHRRLPPKFGFDVIDRQGRSGSGELVIKRFVSVYSLRGPNWWCEFPVRGEDFEPATYAALDVVAAKQQK